MRMEAILWVLRTGVGWRDLPAAFGSWQSVYSCFRTWTRNGLWAAVQTALGAAARDDEYLLIDSTAVRVHAHGAGPAGPRPRQPQAPALAAAGLQTRCVRLQDRRFVRGESATRGDAS